MSEGPAHSRWMPPSPHREVIEDWLRRGRAHLEDRGHGLAPLLVFEDGGAIELPRARWIGSNIVDCGGDQPTGQTRFSDVCGTVDELKRIAKEEPELAATNPERLLELLDDAVEMIGRMDRRRQAYREFARTVASLAERMSQLVGPEAEVAYENAEALCTFIKERPGDISKQLQWFNESAERVRTVAGDLEQTLYPYRDAAKELGALYAGIRGARKWEGQ